MYAWIISSLVMFGLSYFWHGIFLNDYKLIAYPRGIFLTAAAFVYLFIGFLLTRLFHVHILDRISMHPLLRGPAAGIPTGLMVYMIAIVIGITINKTTEIQYMLFDVCWQMLEQAVGGIFVGLSYMYIPESILGRYKTKKKHYQ